MKKNLLLLRDSLERWKTRLTQWQLFQKMFILMLDDIINKYNNTVQKTIKIKPIDVTDDSYAEYN